MAEDYALEFDEEINTLFDEIEIILLKNLVLDPDDRIYLQGRVIRVQQVLKSLKNLHDPRYKNNINLYEKTLRDYPDEIKTTLDEHLSQREKRNREKLEESERSRNS